MARRRPPASTPFGAWLARWLEDNPDWTVEAFAAAVAVSPAAVSLWLTKTKKVGIDHLREVARVTGEDFDELWKMVYRSQAPTGAGPSTADLMGVIAETMRSVLREEPGSFRADEPADPATVRRRRAYWIRRARERLAPKGRKVMALDEIADRMGLEGNTRGLVARWAAGTSDPDPAYFERLARALHIPERDIVLPPMTDEERLDRWAREFIELEPPARPKIARRAS